MINIIDKNEIIIRFKNGQSIKSITRDLKIARNTVRPYIRNYQNTMAKLSQETNSTRIALMQELICSKPTKKNYVKRCSAFTPEVKQRFYELIKIDENRNKELRKNKQQLTAALLHRTLISEGFKISESTIRARYREYKNKHKECFIKQHYDYGYHTSLGSHQLIL